MLGKYRLVAELAQGGMGVVWLAEMRGAEGFKKPVVVKELLPRLARDVEFRAMFLDEARLGGRLVHENIVQTLDVGHEGDRWYIVLELLRGCALDRARKAVRLRPELSVAIVRGVLSGLHHAHELRGDDGAPLGVVHRDVSARNVFLTAEGGVKLLDFGLAKSRARTRQTAAGVVKGSIGYLSPDHVCERALDRRADVFAAGVLLRELLTGERLWAGADERTIVKRLATRDVPAFAQSARVPDVLRRISQKAMAPWRGLRFQSAAEMRDALDASGCVGSLGELRGLFEGPLAYEVDRARLLLQANPALPPPLPVELSSAELVSASASL
jgi:serine/threonine-protein kinase